MSKRSKELRSMAASELRKSRKGGTGSEKSNNRKRAAALKSLADSGAIAGGRVLARRSSPATAGRGGMCRGGGEREKAVRLTPRAAHAARCASRSCRKPCIRIAAGRLHRQARPSRATSAHRRSSIWMTGLGSTSTLLPPLSAGGSTTVSQSPRPEAVSVIIKARDRTDRVWSKRHIFKVGHCNFHKLGHWGRNIRTPIRNRDHVGCI